MHASVADSNPNVEGDINVWIEGLKTLRSLVLERDVKDVSRVLSAKEVDAFDADIEKISAIAREERVSKSKRPGHSTRLLVSTSSSSGSGSSGSGKVTTTGLIAKGRLYFTKSGGV